MPINNITQTISTLPPAGSRGVDVQTQFVIKQEDFQEHLQGTTVTELNTLKTQINTTVTGMNTAVETVNTKASEASASASSASTSANTATTKASEVSASANNTYAYSLKAGKWADNNYNVEVETGKYSAKHWSTVAQNATANKIDKVVSTDNAIVRFNGTTGDVQNSGVIIDDNENLLLTSGTGALGYGAGAGGTVTQLTSKSTAVTLNKPSGKIIIHNAPLAAGATVSFWFYNLLFSQGSDNLIMTMTGATSGIDKYKLHYGITGDIVAQVYISNVGNSSFSDTITLKFELIKGSTN